MAQRDWMGLEFLELVLHALVKCLIGFKGQTQADSTPSHAGTRTGVAPGYPSPPSLEKRTIAQRDWMGSMILELVLQASAKRVVLE